MAIAIKSGNRGTTVKVDANERLHTFSVTRTAGIQATIDEDGYQMNTSLLTLTSAGESGLFYYKHLEDDKLVVDTVLLILGPSTGGSTSDTTRLRIYKNPTTGTLISDATAISINQNRDFGSSNTLADSLAYSGGEAKTITNGSVFVESLISPGNRVVVPINTILRKGNSIAVSLEPNDSNTSMKVMIAMVSNILVSTEN